MCVTLIEGYLRVANRSSNKICRVNQNIASEHFFTIFLRLQIYIFSSFLLIFTSAFSLGANLHQFNGIQCTHFANIEVGYALIKKFS